MMPSYRDGWTVAEPNYMLYGSHCGGKNGERSGRMTNRNAINLLEEVKMLDDTMYAYNSKYLEALDMAIEALKATAQQWIPCSERLPEKDGDYLVTLAFAWGKEIEMGWLLNGEWMNPNSHVTVAWQPLPEPWGRREKE